ncbi:ROK family transcriptional regulator [Draconibacterium sp. IB214405]|uniref:ROK family transcriptional regulator n=1 Tax=Draconibacterium sp. IB214405 TaxID=3097352 RepID=UPI002A15951B|nr:ROK family transcriptional regulator [Draconibacterium sp. IB214405]MDX8340298.1 ROK family transcriptional regulator [Draconibacterium sp. IB214405]
MILLENIKGQKLTGNALKNYRRKKKILSLLYQNDTLSATFLSKQIGVSLPTAISLLKELGNSKLVEVRGSGESKGGRRPTLFGLKRDSIFVISCELGRFRGKIGVYNTHNELVAPVTIVQTSIDDDNLVDKLYAESRQILTDNFIDYSSVFAVGIAMPGLIDSKQGVNYTIKKEEYRNIAERLSSKFDKIVYVNNDARMEAYGEFIFGEAKGYKNAMIINWNWGVGLGMVLNGNLYNGGSGFAGELSHIKFVEDGDLCICGKRGCLETEISAYVLINRAREAVENNRISQLTEKFKNHTEDITVRDIISAAKLGDELSISLLNNVGQALGKALSDTIQLLNPDVIVLGGLVSEANQYVLNPIQQSINQYCLEQISGNTKIVISNNWRHSGLLGITAKLFQKLFSDMNK